MNHRDENHRRRKRWHATLLLSCGLALLGFVFAPFWGGSSVFGAELTIAAVQAKAGQDIRVPITIDQADHLAGIKLVINYNKEALAFTGGARSKSTDSMMHVINDKTPGKLIVVMAAARGISGKDVTLLTLFFNVKKVPTEGNAPLITIVDSQLMGDDLKDIPCKIKNHGGQPSIR